MLRQRSYLRFSACPYILVPSARSQRSRTTCRSEYYSSYRLALCYRVVESQQLITVGGVG